MAETKTTDTDRARATEAPATHRDYAAAPPGVRETYRRNHATQTDAFVAGKLAAYFGAQTEARRRCVRMTLWDLLDALEGVVDASDPDADDLPQSQHAFQTAERLRREHPDKDWLHLVGLIHDCGKVLQLFGEPPEHVVGDTFPVGCAFDPAVVYHGLFAANPDHGRFGALGRYRAGCGFDAVRFSFGHDEYLARVLEAHAACRLPPRAVYVVRYHSFYAWHRDGAYARLAGVTDRALRPLLRAFQRCDLYSKGAPPVDAAALRPYYAGLMRKYGLDGALRLPRLAAPVTGPS